MELGEIIIKELANSTTYKDYIDKFIANEIFEDDDELNIFLNRFFDNGVITQADIDHWNSIQNARGILPYITEEISHQPSDIIEQYLKMYTFLESIVFEYPAKVTEGLCGLNFDIFPTETLQDEFIDYLNDKLGTEIPKTFEVERSV